MAIVLELAEKVLVVITHNAQWNNNAMQAGVYETNDIPKIWSVKLRYKKYKLHANLNARQPIFWQKK